MPIPPPPCLMADACAANPLYDSANLHQHSHQNDAKTSDQNNPPTLSSLPLSSPASSPLHTHVKTAVSHYVAALDGQLPTNLYDTFLQQLEKPLLEAVLEQAQGNQSKAALMLGLNRGTLRKKMQLYGLR